MASDNFYVYEHWRLDKDECFHVGKGKKGRAYSRANRNSDWWIVVNYLENNGYSYEVRIVIDGITEDKAYSIEIEKIAFWKSVGIVLTNKTKGGGGISGYTHTEETRVKLKAAKAGKPNPMQNPVIAKKTSESLKSLGDKHPTKRPEVRAKMSESRKGKCVGSENGFYGKTHTSASLEAMRSKRIGQFQGSKHHNAKLTENDVIEILLSNEATRFLAERFNVSKILIRKIKQRNAWKHVSVEKVNTDELAQ